VVRLAAAGVVVWNAALVVRFTYQFFEYGQLNLADGLGWLAYLVISTVLVLRGVRGAVDRVSWMLLAALAVIVLGVLPFGGQIWTVILGPVAGFGLVFIRRPWSLLAFAAAVVVTVVYSLATALSPGWVRVHADNEQFASYDAVVVVWTGIALAVLVGLARILRDLQAARQQLAERALVVERQRIDGELAETIGAALQLIIEESQDAARLARHDPQAAARQILTVTTRSRAALADARRVFTGYRSISLDAELRAVTTLLAAGGIRATVELPGVELPDGELAEGELPAAVRSRLWAAVAAALSEGAAGRCVLVISRDEDGEPDVRLVREGSAVGEGTT
jgi:two-component system, NarL family, sensor histidine kinase DesK